MTRDVIHGDCLDVMATFEPESIDAIVTDPPYGIGFMGKAWDGPAIERAARRDAETRKTVGPHSSSRPGRTAARSSSAFGSPAHYAGPVAGGRPWQDWCERWAREAFRVAKPGAHLLAFGGTRTYHRLACAIEDAGWEIRDGLVWGFAQGFPKSSRVNRDAAFCQCGATGRNGESTFPAPETAGRIRTGEPSALAVDAARSDGYVTREALGSPGDYLPVGRSSDGLPRLGEVLDPTFAPSQEGALARSRSGELADDPPVGSSRSLSPAPRSALPSSRDYPNPDGALASTPTGTTGSTERGPSTGSDIDSQAGRTVRRGDALAAWPHCTTCGKPNADGYGTALKPAWEPIVLARKPLRGTVASNVQAFGTGALNIDDCRIGTTVETWPASRSYAPGQKQPGGNGETEPTGPVPAGRWPANVILTDPIFDGGIEGVVGGGEQDSPADYARSVDADGGITGWNAERFGDIAPGYGDSGTYSRFFLIPKAARSDREPILGGLEDKPAGALNMRTDSHSMRNGMNSRARQNSHPTVKPVELMRHLVRLVTPPGGVVLDPFLGSGSTAIACELEGFPWIGIEKEAEYVEIARARLNGTQTGMGLVTA